jgi:hypothetical protein
VGLGGARARVTGGAPLRQRLTPRQLNRATLARQLLLERAPLGAVEGVHRVVALQAQEPASPYLALWNRLSPFAAADLDRALADHAVVKATLMRITLHVVDAADYPTFHEAMQTTLAAARLNDRRFTRTGLSRSDVGALIPHLLAFTATPRTNAEVQAFLVERLGPLPEPGVWWALRQLGPFVHAATGGPWSFGPRPSYVAAPDQRRDGDERASLRRLVWRYLEGFGPASVADIAGFGLLYRPVVREAIASLGASLETYEGPDGKELFDVPGAVVPDEATPAPPRLMAMWDSTLLAYSERSRIIPPDYRKLVIRSNGDTLPTLLVDGYVAGVWRPLDGAIEATAFHPLSDDDWTGLETEARALRTFLAERDPAVYRRYTRWWTTLPTAEVRLLAADLDAATARPRGGPAGTRQPLRRAP